MASCAGGCQVRADVRLENHTDRPIRTIREIKQAIAACSAERVDHIIAAVQILRGSVKIDGTAISHTGAVGQVGCSDQQLMGRNNPVVAIRKADLVVV